MNAGLARILLATSSTEGGIAHCAHYQAEELQRRGVAVTMVCSEAFPWPQDRASYRQVRCLRQVNGAGPKARIARRIQAVANHWRIAWHTARSGARLVLLDSNTEYFAFLWAWPHLLLRALGVRRLAVFHDPLRQVRYGSAALHRAELWLFYRTLDGGLIHGDPPAGAWLPRWLDLEVVPHGPFLHQVDAPPAFDLRRELGIGPDRRLILSFGMICDYKNLDLLIAAMAAVPEADLVVAGKVKSARERAVGEYREMARRHGVEGRVHFVERYVPEDEVSAFFAPADVGALTYNAGFVSQSGVLQLAAAQGKTVLASSGDGPLRETVTRFGLGEWVPPGDAVALAAGMQRLLREPYDRSAAIAAYNASVSWEQNIDGLIRLARRLG